MGFLSKQSVYAISDALQMACQANKVANINSVNLYPFICLLTFFPFKWLLIGYSSYVLKTGSGFTCAECGKEFNDQSNCRRHVKISHNHFVGELSCEYCHKAFKNNYALKDHLRKTHGVYNNAV